jgi:ureidoacrylate peracid hydrolase
VVVDRIDPDPTAGATSASGAERLRWAPSEAAVLVIDAQNDFCHPNGVQAQQGQDVSRTHAPLQRLGTFLHVARTAGVPVIFVQTTHGPATDSSEWLARHPDPARRQSCQVDSWGADFCGVGPQPDEPVVVKHRYSAFAGTRLRDLLRQVGRTSVLFTGFTTGTCVESSLREAVSRDLLATLVDDCCGAYTQRAHERAIEAVQAGFGVVTTSARIAQYWKLSSLQGSAVPAEMSS